VSDLPVVSVFGVLRLEFKSAGPVPDFETRNLDCRCHLTDEDAASVIAKERPSIIVAIGKP